MTPPRPARVLVVDDEPDVRMVVGLNLDLAGMEFGEAADGREAIEMLRSGEWDGCVLDLSMPQVDGFAVLKDLSESGRINHMSVVVLSAMGSPTTALEALTLGAHAHLTKPFSPTSVASLVNELINLDDDERQERRANMINRAGDLERLGMKTV